MSITDHPKLHEQGFNYALANVIRSTNARWRKHPEYVLCEAVGVLLQDSLRPDILIEDPRMSKVVIECAYGGDNDKDALARLTHGICNTAITVNIPDHFRRLAEHSALGALENGSPISYALLQSEKGGSKPYRFPFSGYVEGTARDLADVIPIASAPKTHVEKVADEVADLIDQAAKTLQDGLSKDDIEETSRKVYQRTPLTTFRTVLVLWLDAMLVQSHLRQWLGSAIDVLPSSEIKPSKLIDAWQNVLKRNWRSIFKPAVEVLAATGKKARGPTSAALDLLLQAVEVIETSKFGDHVSFAGELFPKISVDRKEAAAFYTTPATAELLSILLIRHSDNHEWGNTDLFKSFCIADLACGTGTLVRSAFRRIRLFHEATGGDLDSLARFHANAMEQGIKAADISPIAAHLTNSGMAVAGGGAHYGKTNISWVSVGEDAGEKITTGSLDYLKNDSLTDMLSHIGSSTGGTEEASSPLVVEDGSVDYVVMNPPYSRTRGGQAAFDIAGLCKKQRNLCQARWGELLKGEDAIKTAGMAASFVCLARKKVKRGGRIGFVLPLTAAFEQTWEVTREMILREFEDIVVVARAGKPHVSEALSADTHHSEMLLLATRKQKSGKATPIRCVSLRRMPVRQGEATEFGRSIQTALSSLSADWYPVHAGEEELGLVMSIDPVGGEPWSELGVLHAELAIGARQLSSKGTLPNLFHNSIEFKFQVPMTKVNSLFQVGPTHHLIGHGASSRVPSGAYVLHPITRKADSKYGVRALWGANAKTQNRLIVEPTHRCSPWKEEENKNSLLEKRGILHYARGIQWTSQALLVAMTPNDVFGGSAWTTLIHEDPRVLKAFSLWGNSTMGLIVQWTNGGRTQKGRSRSQVKAIRQMPCPDIGALPESNLTRAVGFFDDLSGENLKPACQAHVDSVRKEIDKFVANMLGLSTSSALDNIAALRELWCAEPTVHGDNQEALRLLRENNLLD